jgi:hypothetical protein
LTKRFLSTGVRLSPAPSKMKKKLTPSSPCLLLLCIFKLDSLGKNCTPFRLPFEKAELWALGLDSHPSHRKWKKSSPHLAFVSSYSAFSSWILWERTALLLVCPLTKPSTGARQSPARSKMNKKACPI